MKLVITFKTATASTKAHWVVSEEGIGCELIPTPQSLGVKCGYALCAKVSDRGKILDILRTRDIKYSKVHEMEA